MKKKLAIAVCLGLLAGASTPTLARSCNQIGTSTFCDDGSTYNRIGDTTFGSDGSTHQKIGDTTFHSDGTTSQRIGNTTFDSDGTTTQRIGNSLFRSDGTSCNIIGGSMFCNWRQPRGQTSRSVRPYNSGDNSPPLKFITSLFVVPTRAII